MLKRFLAATSAAGLVLTDAAPPAIAQTPQSQHALTSAAARTELRDDIARMADLSPKEIELHATNTTVRVVLVNTDYNHNLPSAPADREYLASNIAALMNKNAEKDPGLKPILVLHVEFVKHGLWSKTIDAIEFRRQADGKFARHQT
jgi:hypothetical protein